MRQAEGYRGGGRARQKARQLGQVFTPAPLANLIAARCISRPEATVFDPCVGEGALLLAAGQRLAALGAAAWHRQLFGLEIDPEAWAIGRQRLAAAAGVAVDEIRVARGDFLAGQWPDLGPDGQASLQAADTLPGLALPAVARCPSPPLFDVAIMNPPYTRQELLPAARKADGHAAGLSRRIGLHGHFWVHLARCLREGGWLGAITTATWLSVDSGHGLRAFLLEQFRVHLLIDLERDVFPDACVEACIAILEKRSGPAAAAARAETPVRFVRLGAGRDPQAALAEALAGEGAGEGEGWRARVVPQAALTAAERWSRFFLPAAAFRVVRAAESAPGVPLAAVAHLRRGITTGNNRVFLLTAEAARAAGIEAAHLRAIVRSPREIPGLDTDAVAAPAKLLLPPNPEQSDSGAAAYLRARGVSGSAYLRGEPPPPAPLLFGYAVRGRKAFFRNSACLLASDNFLEIVPRHPDDVPLLFALLNALPTAFRLETLGRGQGRGLLKIQRRELAALVLPDPARLDPGLRRELESLGEALRREPDCVAARTALDEAACSACGLDPEALRRAEQELVTGRLARKGAW